MPSEDTPAQHKSSETATDADVQCLLNIAQAGAAQPARSSAQVGPGY